MAAPDSLTTVAISVPWLSACSCVVRLLLPRPLVYSVRLNSLGAVRSGVVWLVRRSCVSYRKTLLN